MNPFGTILSEERHRDGDILDRYNDEECRRRFRFSRGELEIVFSLFKDEFPVEPMRSTEIKPFHQFLIALRYYVTGSIQMSTGDLLKVSQATTSRVISGVSYKIAKNARDYISFPSPEGYGEVQRRFYEIDGFPGVIGAIDCTHVPYLARGEPDRERFRNRKNILSINVQAVVDADLKFSNIVARWPGSTHDSRIFDNSRLRFELEQGQRESAWLLGDGGYGCYTYLLTPFRSPASSHEDRYNLSHARTRNTIERAFGVWKNTFQVLRGGVNTKRQTAMRTIVACAVLWNIRRSMNCYSDELIDNINPDQSDVAGDNYNVRINSDGWALRDALVREYFTR